MLSIIVCSRNSYISPKLKINIRDTIGIEHELIVIDNSSNNYSIFSAYNKGLQIAQYPILCFIHDDILFHTNNWGQKVLEHFQNNKTGIIGVAGCHYFPAKASGWWYFTNLLSGQGIQRFYKNENEYYTEHIKSFRFKKDNSTNIDVVAVDGYWMCIRKELFDKISFDDEYYGGGWHGYDIDICLQVLNLDYSVRVVFDILIEHFSNGDSGKDWLNAMILFQKKWSSVLPLVRGGSDESDREFLEQLNWELSQAFNNRDITSFKENYLMISKFKPENLSSKLITKSFIIKYTLLWELYNFFKRYKKKNK